MELNTGNTLLIYVPPEYKWCTTKTQLKGKLYECTRREQQNLLEKKKYQGNLQ